MNAFEPRNIGVRGFSKPPIKQLLSIQYLRAFAAMSAALFHETESIGQHWFSIGNASVDLFFVISGFIMFAVTETQENKPKIFFWRRFTRIVPLYWCATALTVIVCLYAPHIREGVDASFNHVMPSLFFIPHINMFGKNWPTVPQGWTLNIEMFFYVTVTAALFFPRYIQLRLISIFLVLLVVAGACIHPSASPLKAYTNVLLLEFMAGLWIGRIWALGKLPSRNIGIILLGVGLLGLGIDPWLGHHGKFFRPIFWGIPAALMVLGSLSIEANGRIMQITFFKLLGDASYSIYLLHDFMESIINQLPLSPWLKITTSLALVAFIGILAFRWFERPLNALVRRQAFHAGM